MKTRFGYVQFPIFLLRNFQENRQKVINEILDYGIFRYSQKFRYQAPAMAQQIIYDLYRKELPCGLANEIRKLKSKIIGKDNDYNGFIAGSFEPTDEIGELLNAFETRPTLKQMAIEHYQMHLALQSLNISGNREAIITRAKAIMERTPQGEPMAMVKTNFLFEFRDFDKTEFEVMQLLAYIAINSILGKRESTKTNNAHVLARMLGYSSIKQVPENKTKLEKTIFEKYSHRYHIDKVLRELELNWKLLKYGNRTRGFYVSLGGKTNMDRLAIIAESRKKGERIAALKRQKSEARAKSVQHLKQCS